MQAHGEHVLIRKPKKLSETTGGIQLPDTYDKVLSYGRVLTQGAKFGTELGSTIEDGDIVLFDPLGVRDVELDPTRDAGLVIAHAAHIFATIGEDELLARKLPLP